VDSFFNIASTPLIFGCVLVLADVRAEEPRAWTSTDGRFRVVATLIDVQNNRVVLQTDAGKKLRVELKNLSETDRTHVRTFSSREALRTRKLQQAEADQRAVQQAAQQEKELSLAQGWLDEKRDIRSYNIEDEVTTEENKRISVVARAIEISQLHFADAFSLGLSFVVLDKKDPRSARENGLIGELHIYNDAAPFYALSADPGMALVGLSRTGVPYELRPPLRSFSSAEFIVQVVPDTVGANGEVRTILSRPGRLSYYSKGTTRAMLSPDPLDWPARRLSSRLIDISTIQIGAKRISLSDQVKEVLARMANEIDAQLKAKGY
jgi:hypothetical protein